jgi:thymidylate synthase ThyX
MSVETFTSDERQALAPYFTEIDGPVFALVNLPEVVKGALFARYSRSAKSLRRLFLDEFLEQVGEAPTTPSIGTTRAEQLYERVLSDYGDDSVAQLGGVHLACEGASNILTKVLEWGRLMAYLEQSTRYVPYTDRPGSRWKYHVPAELDGHPHRDRYVETLDHAFETYARWIDPMRDYWSRRFPKPASESDSAYRATIRARRSIVSAASCPRPRAPTSGSSARRRVRSAAAPHARASARRGAAICGPDARRAQKGHSAFLRRARAP